MVQYLLAERVSTCRRIWNFYREIGNRRRQCTVTDGECKGNKPCTSYSRTFTIHNYGYGIAYTFTHNNITLEHTAMDDKNTIAHTDAHNTQFWAHCAPPVDAHWFHNALVAQDCLVCVIHVIHACALVVGVLSCLSSSLCPSFSTSSHCSSSSPSWCPPQRTTRGPCQTPCATPAWWAWSHPTTSHPSHTPGLDFLSGIKSICDGFEQRHRSSWRSAWRTTVTTECEGLCMPIKGQSKTTKKGTCWLFTEYHSDERKELDWYWTRNHTLSAYEASKKVNHLHRHSQQVQREDDGAVHLWRIKEHLQSQLPQFLYWSDGRWNACLAVRGEAKRRFQYCIDDSGIIKFELLKDSHDAILLILHCNTMLWFRADSSKIFTFLDVESIFIHHQLLINTWRSKIRARDRQYSSCLSILGAKVTRILTRLTSMNHVVHNACTMQGRNVKTRYIGSTSILQFGKENISWYSNSRTKWLRKSVYNDKYTFKTNVDNWDTTYTDKHSTTCARSEHACTLLDVLSFITHVSQPHWLKSSLESFSFIHIPSMMSVSLWVARLLLLLLPAFPRLFSCPSSPCTPTTLTPWLTTCATPPTGLSSPPTIPSRSQKHQHSIRLDRMQSSFKEHSQSIVFQQLLDWKLDKSCTTNFKCHLDLLQRPHWSTNGQENWVRKLLGNQKRKLLDKKICPTSPTNSKSNSWQIGCDLMTCKMEETRPVPRRSMLIQLTKKSVLQTERSDFLKQEI